MQMQQQSVCAKSKYLTGGERATRQQIAVVMSQTTSQPTNQPQS